MSRDDDGNLIEKWCCRDCPKRGVHFVDSKGNCWMPSEVQISRRVSRTQRQPEANFDIDDDAEWDSKEINDDDNEADFEYEEEDEDDFIVETKGEHIVKPKEVPQKIVPSEDPLAKHR